MRNISNKIYTQEVGGSSPSSPTIPNTEGKVAQTTHIKKECLSIFPTKFPTTPLEIGSRLPI